MLFCSGSSTSSNADDGSPRQSLPSLSTSSSTKTGSLRPCPADRLDDPARHRADVGPPVAANLGLVAHAAERHAGHLAAQRPCDRLREAGLADARRSDEAEDRLAARSPARRSSAALPACSFRTARYSRIRSLIFSRS